MHGGAIDTLTTFLATWAPLPVPVPELPSHRSLGATPFCVPSFLRLRRESSQCVCECVCECVCVRVRVRVRACVRACVRVCL